MGMMKTVAIWGSTGVIGTTALKIAMDSGYRIVAIIGNKNHKLLIEQAKLAKPEYVGVADRQSYEIVKDTLSIGKIEVLTATEFENLAKLDVTCSVMAIAGHASLQPTFACIGHAQRLAIASKEAIISGGKLLQTVAKEKGTEIIPIDSEHNSILQCLLGENKTSIKELILTASGGAFADFDENEFKNVTLQDALKHPNWQMGIKNTIDSATLFNKALELIEASYLFDINITKIKAIIHPNSIIHAMVKFMDNSYKSLMSFPDMKLPISYALNYPNRCECNLPELDFEQIYNLSFKKPKAWQRRNINLAYYAVQEKKVIAFNIANEVAVSKFITGKLQFAEIYKYVIEILAHSQAENVNSFEDIQAIIQSIKNSE